MAFERLVVVGASLAGPRTFEAVCRAGSVTLIRIEARGPHDRPPLPEVTPTAPKTIPVTP